MIDQDLLTRVVQLSLPERLELLEALTHSLRQDIAPDARPAHAPPEHAATLAAITERAKALHLAVPATSSLHGVLGIAAGAVPMTKDEVRDVLADALLEKYS